MKRILSLLIISLLLNNFCFSYEYPREIQSEISEQLKSSDVGKIKENLPDYSIDLLEQSNIKDIFSVKNLNNQKIFYIVLNLLKKYLINPLKTIIPVISAIIIYSFFSYFFVDNQKITKFIITCFSCISMSYPVLITVKNVVLSLNAASKFVLFFIPIFMTFAISAGTPLSSAAFNSAILYFNQIVMEITNHLVVPINNTLTGLCMISSLSTEIKIKKIFDIFYSIIKWCLIFFGSLISFVFSIQKIIGESSDSIISKEIKFASGLVPIVGTSLSDAAGIVQSSAKILETNVGIFGIISLFFVFLPCILECISWNIVFQICEFLSQIFGFENLEILFSSLKKTINVILSLVIIFLFIFIFSTGAIISIKL